jgi:sugar (pentulose or hexulose) kinase
MSALIIDVGSTSIKASGLEEMPTPTPFPTAAGRHETNPMAYLDAVQSLISAAGEVSAVAFSTQMHGVLLTDSSNKPVSPFLSWQDERALEGALLTTVAGAAAAISGIPPRAGIGAATLARYLEENPLPGGRIHTIGSFLISRLGGPYVTHVTNAAPLGLVDLSTGQWSAELIAAYGLSAFELPTIVSGYESLGSGLYPDLGDHQASVLGSGLEDDEFAVSLGTAGIGARLSSSPAAPAGVEVRPYVDGRFLHVRSRQSGGRLAAQFFAAFVDLARVAGRDVGEAAFWDDVSGQPGGLWGGVVERFLDQYVEGYRAVMGQLFGASVPSRLRLNGGMAAHIPWFRDEFGNSLGLATVTPPPGDLAVRGIAQLLRRVDVVPR